MLQNITNLNDRVYKATIGMSKADFEDFTVHFEQATVEYQQAQYEKYEAFYERRPSKGGKAFLQNASERLFFILYYLKTYPSFDVLGFILGCSGKTAHTNLYKLLPILEHCLENLKVLPRRKFDTVEDFIAFTKSHTDLLIDATERLHHRKKDKEEQKKYYTKKKSSYSKKYHYIY